jgi:hypothetical protein
MRIDNPGMPGVKALLRGAVIMEMDQRLRWDR